VKIASVAEVKQHSAFVKASEAGPVVVTRNGKAVAVIVAVQDDDEVECLLMVYSPRPLSLVVSQRGVGE
jgi:antitoxin (DNA-binding transcriptional repressor) of toxin-antitoxin stability system